ncbi:hypothetical protein TWF281_011419 [Arthrobotrys megalospora]
MKGNPRSTNLVLKTLQSSSKPPGPLSRLASIFNHPVLTDSESKVLLKEINSSFRNALNESRHPNDIRPPPSIHNAYANKADNHIFKVLTDPRPASPPNVGSLRDLLDPEALVDTGSLLKVHDKSPISIFQNHLLQGTADLPLAVECCKAFIRLQRTSNPYSNQGLRMYQMIYGNSLFFHRNDIPYTPLRPWLTAALLISREPTIPFQWLMQYLESRDHGNFISLLKEIMTAYGKIYNTAASSNQEVKFFVHLLKLREKDYRIRISEHPPIKASMHIDWGVIIKLNALMHNYKDEPLLEPVVRKLYRGKDDEAKRMLAESMHLWDTHRSLFGVEVLVEKGDILGAADYLINLPDRERIDALSSNVVLGLLLARKLKEEQEEKVLADRVMETAERSLRQLMGPGGFPSTVLSISNKVLLKWDDWKSSDLKIHRYVSKELEKLERKVRDSEEFA